MNNFLLRFIGDPVLRMQAAPVREINNDVRALLDIMEKIMCTESGAGLAAPQVGVLARMLVFVEERGGEVFKAINPKIISRSENTVFINEGCLSIQGADGPVFTDVERPESVVVEWTNENGELVTKEFGGFASRVIQHEMDHLDGTLFIDHLSSVKREMIMRKVKKRK